MDYATRALPTVILLEHGDQVFTLSELKYYGEEYYADNAKEWTIKIETSLCDIFVINSLLHKEFDLITESIAKNIEGKEVSLNAVFSGVSIEHFSYDIDTEGDPTIFTIHFKAREKMI